MALLRSLFWFAIFLLSTFLFTVIFEHGFTDFQNNAQKEYENILRMIQGDMKRKADKSDEIPPK